MSSHPMAGAADLFAHYQPAPGAYDEWRDEAGQPRPHWQALTQHLEHPVSYTHLTLPTSDLV